MLSAALLLLCGIAISTIAMSVGIGGGILWAPLLIVVYGLSPVEAVTYSLIIQVFGMGSGTLAFYRGGQTDLKLSALLAAVAVPGVIIGIRPVSWDRCYRSPAFLVSSWGCCRWVLASG